MQRLTAKTKRETKEFSRRTFLKGMGVTSGMIALGDQLLTMRAHAAQSAGEQIRIGICGLGERGYGLLQTFLKVPGVEVAYLCDTDPRAIRAAYSLISGKREPIVVTDFRRVLDDRSVEAVVIATPDHWHALMGIKACEAGKNCYIENPCSYTFAEGQQLVTAAEKHQSVVQYGHLGKLTDVSGIDPIALACVGKIHSTRTTIYTAGPRATTHHGGLGFFTLHDLHRNIRMLGSAFPSRVSTLTAGRTPTVSRTAVQMEFVTESTERSRRLNLEVVPISALPPDMARRIGQNLVSETTITGSNGTLTATTQHDRALETEYLVENFIFAVRERNKQLLASPICEAHVSCGSLHLANISSWLKRPINFDPASQSTPDDLQVQDLLLGRTVTLKQ